jgi:glycosyl transferase family 25
MTKTEKKSFSRRMKVDKIYVITIDHSQQNYDSIIGRLNLLCLPPTEYQIVEGVNGREQLSTPEDRKELGVETYSGWKMEDEYKWWNRAVTVGEAGLTLTKIRIWEDAYAKGYENILILEDDFNPNQPIDWSDFDELEEFDYDLIYLSRILQDGFSGVEDRRVGLRNFVSPGFSYQTHAYILSRNGIKKLVETNVPVLKQNLIAADEFLPATYTWHPRQDLRCMFVQNMQALALNSKPIGQFRNETAGESLTAPIEGIDK